MKRLFIYLSLIVKADFKEMGFEWRLRSNRILVRRSIRRAIKLNLVTNKMYYVFRLTKKTAKGIPIGFTSGKFYKGGSGCVIFSTKQAKLFFYKACKDKVLKRRWKLRHSTPMPDCYIVQDHLRKNTLKDFDKLKHKAR